MGEYHWYTMGEYDWYSRVNIPGTLSSEWWHHMTNSEVRGAAAVHTRSVVGCMCWLGHHITLQTVQKRFDQLLPEPD